MRSLVLALIIFGTIPFILARPFFGLLVWSWLGYMNPHRLTYGFAYSFPWVLLIAIVTLVSLAVSSENKKIQPSTVSVLLMVFLVWTAFTTFFAIVPDAAWLKWQQFAKTLVMVFVTLMLVNNRQRMHWLVWMIVVSLGFYGIKGGVFTILRGGAYHVFGPPGSFIADNNALAMAFCMVLPLMRYLQLQTSHKFVRIGLGVAMFLTGVATLGTYSRGGLIGLAVVTAALLLRSRRRITLAIALAAVGMMAYQFMPSSWIERMDTIHNIRDVGTFQTRVQSWEFAANVALHHPLVGGGFDVYESTAAWSRYGPAGAEPRAVHSIFFRVLGEQGFPGFVVFIALLAASWRFCDKTRRLTRTVPGEKWAFDLASMFQVSLLAFMAAGSATTISYFDLSYQIMAMCSLVYLMERKILAQSASAAKPSIAREGSRLPSLPAG